MNKIVLTAFFLIILMSTNVAGKAKGSLGLVSGNMSTADACGYGMGYTGVYLGYGQDASVVLGVIRYGFSPYSEGRIKLGFSDLDAPATDPKMFYGLDLKYKFMDYNDKMINYPLDMAVGILIEYVGYESESILELGVNLIGSIPYRFKSGRRIIPYLRTNIRLEKTSSELVAGQSESNFRVGCNPGVKYELSSHVDLYGEVQIDGNTGLFVGIELLTF